ncbi:LacI family DNA-binding transcriptional regulator, partial [Paraburkholderia sp. EG285A]
MTDGTNETPGAPNVQSGPTPGPNVTLEEIARAAGVSPSTVSRILNGTARVLPEKQRAVEEAIARFNYRPNVLA